MAMCQLFTLVHYSHWQIIHISTLVHKMYGNE